MIISVYGGLWCTSHSHSHSNFAFSHVPCVCVCRAPLLSSFDVGTSAHISISCFSGLLAAWQWQNFWQSAGCWLLAGWLNCLNCASHELSNWNTITTYKNINKKILKKPAMLGKPIRVLWCEEVRTPDIISSVIFVKRHIIVGHWLPWLAG